MLKKITLFLIIAVSLILAVSLIRQIIDATKSGDRLSQAANAVYNLEIKNKELKEKLVQIKTPDYIELQARDKLNLSKKGETVVIIPEDRLKLVMGASASAQEIRLPNYLGWLKVFWR